MPAILDHTVAALEKRYGAELDELLINDVRIGLHMSAIVLSDGSTGISSTAKPSNSEIHRKKEDRDFGDFTPNQITGRKVVELLKNKKQGALVDTLKIAALNALSSQFIKNSGYKILRFTDPIDLIDLNPDMTITLVGAFQSYIQRIAAKKSRLHVLEMNINALEEEDRKYYVPAPEFRKVLPHSNLVIITGLTLVNHTLDPLLETIPPDSRVIVTGPSSSIIPDVLFENNVDIIGAIRINDASTALKLVSEGAAGYHMFQYCAEKICILRD